MKISCTRRFRFDAAHRVMNHESKCANLHGHGYEILITAEAGQLDSLGRIIDFSVLKEKVGRWLDEEWDHTAILFEKDKAMVEAVQKVQVNKKVFVSNFNPTAENMAQFLLSEICPKVLKGTGVQVTAVRVYETPNCFADATL